MNYTFKKICVAGSAAVLLFAAGAVFAKGTRLAELMEAAKERAQNTAGQIKQLRQEGQERAKEIREAQKEKINRLKDQNKRQAADKIAGQLAHINQTWTDHFTRVLDHLDAILQKIRNRAEKASADGKDISTVTAAIQKAEDAIASARLAVAAQAQKTYVLSAGALADTATSAVDDQENLLRGLKDEFKRLRSALFRDLALLRDGPMRDARTSLFDALQALSQIPDVNGEPAKNSNNQ